MIEAAKIYVFRTARLELLLAVVAVGALTAAQAWTALQVVGVALDPGVSSRSPKPATRTSSSSTARPS
ncbi:MAG: hypothetical protein KatS3mg065_0665 [Chloroflexota bacterium]|nr:MAG: hypothetical protein KatS3mg065_0665 [Chloroflexota bacterium]